MQNSHPDTSIPKDCRVDESGQPIIFYHGTPEIFDEFRSNDIGVHFGSLEQARRRARKKAGAEDYRIIPVFLMLRNPLRTADAGCWFSPNQAFEKIDLALKRLGLPRLPAIEGDRMTRFERARSYLESLGFDGIIYRNTAEGKGDSMIVFSNEQIHPLEPVLARQKRRKSRRP